ncbi:MAG: hypothetical protein BMS9Abin05_0611 [Rhodothermia bacterium]|nr:MAG: hypothetical protein BMS9Abin05_0611 [Rhodothermia bacterium]
MSKYLLLFISFVVVSPATSGQELLKDINQQGYGSNPRYLSRVNNRVFFQARDLDHGLELWVSDGSANGTNLVKDIVPGKDYSAPQQLVPLGDKIVFATADPHAVWVSDGTEIGTLVLHDFESSLDQGSGGIWTMIRLGERIFFSYFLGRSVQLWATDGTPEGTIRIHAETKADQYAVELTAFHDSLYFVTYVPGDPHTVWRMDPEESAPEKFLTSDVVNATRLFTDDERLFLMAGTVGDIPHLWVSDGTVSGTEYLRFIGGAPHAEDGGFFGSLGDRVLFFAKDGVHGFEPWVSNGTVAGTFMLADTNPGEAGTTIYGESARIGNQVFFQGKSEDVGTELWVTDGTSAGTHLVTDINPGPISSFPDYLSVIDDRLLFRASDGVHGKELWTSDGTVEGTTMLMDFNEGGGSGAPNRAVEFPGGFIISASDGPHGQELWISDGTPAGSELIKDIDSRGTLSSSISRLALFDNELFFRADDGVIGSELWKTDGTTEGTLPASDLFEGSSGSSPRPYGVVNQRLIVEAKTPETGRILWAFPPGGLAPEPLIPTGANPYEITRTGSWTMASDALVFYAQDNVNGDELWITDGTPLGTRRLTAGGLTEDNPWMLGFVNDHTVFSARDGSVYNLYGSDRSGNTSLLFSNVGTNRPDGSEPLDGRILFSPANGNLYSTDGTPNGTQLVRTLNQYNHLSSFSNAGQLVFFDANDRNGSGIELWRSDGTPQGTFLLKDIYLGSEDSYPYDLFPVGNRLFFTAVDGEHGRELWVTDGSMSGTHLVADVVPGPEASAASPLLAIENLLLFSADDGVHGRELWISDGTETGTYMVLDFVPGVDDSYPDNAMVLNDRILLTFTHTEFGEEFWTIALSAIVVASETISVTPTGFSLSENYPNPFIGNTVIRYSLPFTSRVQIEVFDLLGKRVIRTDEGLKHAGKHQIQFDGSGLSAGIYFYTLTAGESSQTRKMVVVK